MIEKLEETSNVKIREFMNVPEKLKWPYSDDEINEDDMSYESENISQQEDEYTDLPSEELKSCIENSTTDKLPNESKEDESIVFTNCIDHIVENIMKRDCIED